MMTNISMMTVKYRKYPMFWFGRVKIENQNQVDKYRKYPSCSVLHDN